ncbi:MAG: glycosyltransferase family 4 protein [Bacilli bacterium]|nr:glycosyltransferase family 4 protein [Bacilli bacterium]
MKVFILTTITAPYRVNLFNELGKKCKLRVCFEQKRDLVKRNDEWYDNKSNCFEFITLKKWDKGLKKIKWDVFKHLKEFKPDIVIAYEYSTITALLLMSYCKKKKIPYLINCDGAIPSNNIIKTWIKKHYVKNADGYFANGISAKNYFLKYKGEEEKIIPYKFSNYYQKDILSVPLTKEEKEKKKKKMNLPYKKIFLTIGRFEYLKGFDLLFEATRSVSKNKDVVFIIIGGGPLEKEFKDKIRKEKINNIIILPYMDTEELKEYYDISDGFIFPTRRDVWGLVVGEAMSRGLPVISTNSSMAGIELIENDKNGYVIENENIKQLEKAIQNMIQMTPEELYQFGNESIQRIQGYDIENMADTHYQALMKIYEKNRRNNG